MAYTMHERTLPHGVVLSPPRHDTPPQGGTPGQGGPRAGEDEPESTRDNDEKVEKTSHRDTGRNSPHGGGTKPHADKPAPAGQPGQAPC